jgi:hypothetical protein
VESVVTLAVLIGIGLVAVFVLAEIAVPLAGISAFGGSLVWCLHRIRRLGQ